MRIKTIALTITIALVPTPSSATTIRQLYCQATYEENQAIDNTISLGLDVGTPDSHEAHILKRATQRVVARFKVSHIIATLSVFDMLRNNPDLGQAQNLFETTTACQDDGE